MKKSVIIILLLAIIISASLSGCCMLTKYPTYTASGMIIVSNSELSSATVFSSTDIAASQDLCNTINSIGSTNLVRDILEKNFPNEEYIYNFEFVNDTMVLRVSVTSEDPAISAEICNEIMHIFPSVLEDVIEGYNCTILSYAKTPTKPDKIRFFR